MNMFEYGFPFGALGGIGTQSYNATPLYDQFISQEESLKKEIKLLREALRPFAEVGEGTKKRVSISADDFKKAARMYDKKELELREQLEDQKEKLDKVREENQRLVESDTVLREKVEDWKEAHKTLQGYYDEATKEKKGFLTRIKERFIK